MYILNNEIAISVSYLFADIDFIYWVITTSINYDSNDQEPPNKGRLILIRSKKSVNFDNVQLELMLNVSILKYIVLEGASLNVKAIKSSGSNFPASFLITLNEKLILYEIRHTNENYQFHILDSIAMSYLSIHLDVYFSNIGIDYNQENIPSFINRIEKEHVWIAVGDLIRGFILVYLDMKDMRLNAIARECSSIWPMALKLITSFDDSPPKICMCDSDNIVYIYQSVISNPQSSDKFDQISLEMLGKVQLGVQINGIITKGINFYTGNSEIMNNNPYIIQLYSVGGAIYSIFLITQAQKDVLQLLIDETPHSINENIVINEHFIDYSHIKDFISITEDKQTAILEKINKKYAKISQIEITKLVKMIVNL